MARATRKDVLEYLTTEKDTEVQNELELKPDDYIQMSTVCHSMVIFYSKRESNILNYRGNQNKFILFLIFLCNF